MTPSVSESLAKVVKWLQVCSESLAKVVNWLQVCSEYLAKVVKWLQVCSESLAKVVKWLQVCSESLAKVVKWLQVCSESLAKVVNWLQVCSESLAKVVNWLQVCSESLAKVVKGLQMCCGFLQAQAVIWLREIIFTVKQSWVMVIRRGGVTVVPWFLARLEIKCLIFINTLPCCNYDSIISQLSVLASHTGNLGSVAQGTLELEHWKNRKCHFLSDPCEFGYIF